MDELIAKVRSQLSDDLRKKEWQGNPNPMAGHCYVASECLYHLLGESDYVPTVLKLPNGGTHWYLTNKIDGSILDATFDQFEHTPNYSNGRNSGFLTKQPSKRCLELMRRIT